MYCESCAGNARYSVVDTSLREVLAPQENDLVNFVGPYLQIADGRGAFLIDTAGRRLTASIPGMRIAGTVRDKAGKILLLAGRYEPMEYSHRRAPKFNPRALNVTLVLDSAGNRAKGFEQYGASFRGLTMRQKGQLRRDDVLFATTKSDRVGLLDAAARVVAPAISFKYPVMDFIAGGRSLAVEKSPYRRIQHRYPYPSTGKEQPGWNGYVLVLNDTGRCAYFFPSGKAPFPAINFRYGSLQRFGDHTWIADSRKIVNEQNELLPLPLLSVQRIDPVSGYTGLFQVTTYDAAHGRHKFYYISGNGLLYADGVQ